jgi:amino acid transporter
VLYLLIQLVAQGTLGPDLANYPTAPLAEAAARFLGGLGRTILLVGATISAFGFVTSDILSSPRILFAFGRDGVIPAWFAHVHPRYRSPDVAIISYAVMAFAMSATSSFAKLAVLSNVAVLLMYLPCCAAAWMLLRRDRPTDDARFGFPGAQIVPVLAIIAILVILAAPQPWSELIRIGEILAAASVLYFGWTRLRPT